MKVKCVICDELENIEDESPLAKKLRNRPIHTYMCDSCRDRITKRTKERFADENYKIYHRMVKKTDEW